MNLPTMILLAIFGYCDNMPISETPDECSNEIIQCYTDDNFTIEECIDEYHEENF